MLLFALCYWLMLFLVCWVLVVDVVYCFGVWRLSLFVCCCLLFVGVFYSVFDVVVVCCLLYGVVMCCLLFVYCLWCV